MSTTENEGQDGLAPKYLKTINEFEADLKKLSDDELEAQMEVYKKATHTGAWGRDRLALIREERSRRWRLRRGEGRVA